jgi:SAM-dependent methyltransferase
MLEIGGGYSRILPFFKDEIEGWNLDKFEGVGNGPKQIPKDHEYILVTENLGVFDDRLPDEYFDLVFSISVLEHINEPDDILQNIMRDIDRILKPGGYSVHCIDCRFPPASNPSIDARRMAKYMILQYGLSPQYVIDTHKNDDVFYMSGLAYDRFWKKACNNRPHELDGLPFNIFLAVQKEAE